MSTSHQRVLACCKVTRSWVLSSHTCTGSLPASSGINSAAAAAAAKSLQSCPTLCNLIDSSPPGSPIPGILQARTLEWVAISFSNAWKWKLKVKSLSRVRLLATPWTAAYQAPPSMGFLAHSKVKFKIKSGTQSKIIEPANLQENTTRNKENNQLIKSDTEEITVEGISK